MTFSEFKQQFDTLLGLGSSAFEDEEGNKYLEYNSTTGIVLFSLHAVEVDGEWKVRPISDPLPELSPVTWLKHHTPFVEHIES